MVKARNISSCYRKDQGNPGEQTECNDHYRKSGGKSDKLSYFFCLRYGSDPWFSCKYASTNYRSCVENRKSIDFDDSVTYIKDFVVDKMERQKRMLAPYLLNEKISEYEGGFSRDRNTCLMIGKVFHVYHPKEDFTVVTLQIPSGSRMNQADVVCFKKTGRTGREFVPGDTIAVSADT
ncbi:MAG: hypothetical protein ACLTX3_06810 [Lachnospiraceae bacterium]